MSILWKCDSVVHEAQQIVLMAHKWHRRFGDQFLKEKQEIQNFIGVVVDNLPNFSAARFFIIDRSAIFSMLYTIITFLIVMIQFKENQVPKKWIF